MFSGGFRGGSRGSLEPPSGPKLFHFHREFQKVFCEIGNTNPPFLHLNPLFRNPGSAPDVSTNILYNRPYHMYQCQEDDDNENICTRELLVRREGNRRVSRWPIEMISLL